MAVSGKTHVRRHCGDSPAASPYPFRIGTSYLLEYFAGKYRVDQFSFVDDKGDLHENTPISDSAVQTNFGCVLGCGIFELTKL